MLTFIISIAWYLLALVFVLLAGVLNGWNHRITEQYLDGTFKGVAHVSLIDQLFLVAGWHPWPCFSYKPDGIISWLYRGDLWHTTHDYALLSWSLALGSAMFPVFGWWAYLSVPVTLLIEGIGFSWTYRGGK
jgi:hypothetical protein